MRDRRLTPLLRLRAAAALATARREDGPQLREALFAPCPSEVLRECLAPLSSLFSSLAFLDGRGGTTESAPEPAAADPREARPVEAAARDEPRPVVDLLLDQLSRSGLEIDVDRPDSSGCRNLLVRQVAPPEPSPSR